MIVRILGEGQYQLPEDDLPELERLDHQLNEAIEDGDEAGFARVLGELIVKVKSAKALEASTLVPSDLTVPHEGSSLAEVRDLLAEEAEDAEPVTEGA